MRDVARVGRVLAVMFAGIVLPGAAAQACRCFDGSTADQLQSADAVFFGEIVDRTPLPSGADGTSTLTPKNAYTIDVDLVFKGSVYDEQQVLAGGSSSMCGLTLPASGTVLVYGSTHGNDSPPRYITSSCSGSTMTDSVPAVLGEGDAPLSSTSAYESQLTITPDADEDSTALWVVGGVAILALVGLAAAVVVWRRRPSEETP